MRVIVLPGMDGSQAVRAAFLAALSETVATTFVPLPDTVVLDHASAVALARLHLPVDEPYVIVAESFSGPTAIRIAAPSPAGLRGLVLCSTFLCPPRPVMIRLAIAASGSKRRVSPRLFDWALLGQWSTPERLAVLMDAVAHHPPEVARARLRSIATEDQRAAASRLRIPVLCIHGTHDRLVPRESFQLTCRYIPGCTQALLPGPHALTLAQPALVARQVLEFLRRNGWLEE